MRTKSGLEIHIEAVEEALVNVKELWSILKQFPCGCEIDRACQVCQKLDILWSKLELAYLVEGQKAFPNRTQDPLWAKRPRSHSGAPASGREIPPELQGVVRDMGGRPVTAGSKLDLNLGIN